MGTPIYNKPHLSVAEQVELLRTRGMEISDSGGTANWLRVIGYYRLSGYWYPYRLLADGERQDRFVPATSFDQVIGLYDFDRRLRLLMLEALERVEIAMRFCVGYTLGRRGAYAHLDPAALDRRFSASGPNRHNEHTVWLEAVRSRQRKSREDFVAHFRNKYDGRLPTWVVTEILDFGHLSVLYQGLTRKDRDEIAESLQVCDRRGHGNGRALANWMRALTYLRNVCAHHARLWNRNLDLQIAPSHLLDIPPLAHLHHVGNIPIARLFGPLCVVAFMLNQITPADGTIAGIAGLIAKDLPPTGRRPTEMGFPADWELRLLQSARPMS